MANKSLDADLIDNLLGGKRNIISKPVAIITAATTSKPDPLRQPRVGDMLPGDKGDIWTQWVKQGRKGAAELIERWGS